MLINKLSVIIPVYNEEHTVISVLEKVYNVQLTGGITKEIIIINDASVDGSRKRIEDFISGKKDSCFRFFNHEINKGKGGSIHTALEKITGDYFIIQDADLELNPEDFNVLLQPVLSNNSDVVFGSRFLQVQQASTRFSISLAANKFLTLFSNLAFGTRLTDMETCYKLIPAKAMKGITLVEERFGFEPEITAKLARNRSLRITEVPVRYNARTNKQGKKIGWKDGVRAVWCIIKYGLLRK